MHYGRYAFFLSIHNGTIRESVDLREHIEQDKWETLSAEEQETLLRELLDEWASDYINSWFKEDPGAELED
jgi:hypothetical protein